MSVEENKVITRRMEEMSKENMLTLMDELMAENVVVNMQNVVVEGLENWKQVSTVMLTAFPDMYLTIEDMVAEGDKVVIRVTWQGTHQGNYFNIAPTGKKVTLITFNIYRFEEGKMAEIWMLQDRLDIFEQLGVSPPEA